MLKYCSLSLSLSLKYFCFENLRYLFSILALSVLLNTFKKIFFFFEIVYEIE